MPLNTGDQYYRAELIPPMVEAMQGPLCSAFGVGADSFGSRGNVNHTSGYHRSRRWILNSPDSAHGTTDYSIQLGADQGGDWNDVSAFDFTPGVWGSANNRARMRALTSLLITACQNHDPRVASLREVAGTLDGKTVVTWDCSRNAFKAPFDSSHLDHVHGSIYRSRARLDHSGIVAVMLGQANTQGADMTPAESLALTQVHNRVEALLNNRDARVQSGTAGVFVPENNALADAVANAGGTVEIDQATRDALTQAVSVALSAGFDAMMTAWANSPDGRAALAAAANLAEDS